MKERNSGNFQSDLMVNLNLCLEQPALRCTWY